MSDTSTQEQASDIESGERIEMLRTMQRIRSFETRVGELFEDGEIAGFAHLYLGEEAVATGVCQALSDDDYITSTHRGHGHCIAKGHETDRMMAELFGKETGYCGGKGGSMHIADPTLGNLGANGIVGGGIPIGIGAALSGHLKGTDQVGVSFFGDGATAQGSFHEALNLAASWDLPYIGVVEHNHYGEMTSTDTQQAVDDLTEKAKAFGIPGIDVDGMDVEDVYQSTQDALERARSGEGPTLLVCDTYRFDGHHLGDTEPYREDSEVDEWRQRDPVKRYPERLIDEGVITQDDHEELKAEIEEEIENAIEFARESPMPSPEQAYESLYSEEV